jgi:CheY-like chemotaxis protein
VVLNLLSNALKFTESGGVTVTVTTRPGDRGWEIRLAVQDTGIGIPPGAMGRLFQSFSQADVSTARRFGGTGLGLAISRRLAELMGGTLTATSDGIPGGGSRFELEFVAQPAPIEAGVGDRPAAVASDGRAPGPDTLADRGLRVLLAEDQEMNQKLALRLLANLGITADLARDGVEAVAALARAPFDVILMDVQMPNLDGLDATRQIRATVRSHQPWIIAMTANAMEGDRDACLAAGMDDYLSKPIRPPELAAALARAPVGDEPVGAR